MSSEQNELEIEQQHALSSKKVLSTSQPQPNDDEKDLDIEDYDPTESAEVAQAAKDQIDDNKTSDDTAEVEEEIVKEMDEAELVNSESFAEELQSAIAHVQNIAKTHRTEMIRAAKEQYERETGRAPTPQMISDAMQTMKDSLDREEEREEVSEAEAQPTAAQTDSADGEDIDGAVSASEMESALEVVRSLGRAHRAELEQRFRAQFRDVNGVEATAEEVG